MCCQPGFNCVCRFREGPASVGVVSPTRETRWRMYPRMLRSTSLLAPSIIGRWEHDHCIFVPSHQKTEQNSTFRCCVPVPDSLWDGRSLDTTRDLTSLMMSSHLRLGPNPWHNVLGLHVSYSLSASWYIRAVLIHRTLYGVQQSNYLFWHDTRGGEGG